MYQANLNSGFDTKEPELEDLAFSRLLPYVRLQMPNYLIGKHHRMIAHYLEKLEKGEVTRLAIFMPPRHGKTQLASDFFSSWYLGRNPSHEVIFTSYAQDRSDDVGKSVRNSMLSESFETVFPDAKLKIDAKGTRKFQTISGGSFFSVGVGGAITGRGADLLIMDDLIKDRADAQSDISRRKREEWFTSTAYTRLMSDEVVDGGRILLIMTRWAYDDIASFLLDQLAHEHWHILNCPAIAEEGDVLGREPGEPLWPQKYPLKRLQAIKQSITADDWNALYQQRPLPKEGGLVKLHWFNIYDSHRLRFMWDLVKDNKPLPEELQWFNKIIISVDSAYKPNQINDPSAITVWGYSKHRQYLLEAETKRLEFPELKTWIKRYHEKYRQWNMGPVPVLIEDAASGQSLIQVLRQESQIPVIPIRPDKSKIIRMEHASDYIEAGRVYLPERALWLTDYQTELAQFPYGKHDDQVDSTSQYLRWVWKPKKRRRRQKIFFK